MPNTSDKRRTSYDPARVAVAANGSNVRRKAARKQWKPNTKTRTMPFFLDDEGNAYVYEDENGNRI